MHSTNFTSLKNGLKRHQKSFKFCIGLGVLFLSFVVSGEVEAQGTGNPGMSHCRNLEMDLTEDDTAVRVERDGVNGMFFPMRLARLILCESSELRLRRREAQLFVQQATLLASQLTMVDRQAELATQARDHAIEMFNESQDRLIEVQNAKRPWWRSPFLWTAIGAILGIGIFIGAAYALGSISP